VAVPRVAAAPVGASSSGRPLVSPRPLGVGFPYVTGVPASFYRAGLIDFVEVTPELLCRERRDGARRTLELIPAALDRAREACQDLPMVVHGVELSIGSAAGWNVAYVEMLDRLWSCWPFQWHSEHLGFQTIPRSAETHLPEDFVETGVPLPLPNTLEAVAVVAPRAAALGARYGTPFLLENPAHYLPGLPDDEEIGGEAGLMNRITVEGDCWQLLDLHNLYCNALNLGRDIDELLREVRWERVLEIHVAGGSWRNGYYMDGHDGAVPEQVWQVLEKVLPRATNVAGLVFEVLDQAAARLGPNIIEVELERLRRIWQRSRKSSPRQAQGMPSCSPDFKHC